MASDESGNLILVDFLVKNVDDGCIVPSMSSARLQGAGMSSTWFFSTLIDDWSRSWITSQACASSPSKLWTLGNWCAPRIASLFELGSISETRSIKYSVYNLKMFFLSCCYSSWRTICEISPFIWTNGVWCNFFLSWSGWLFVENPDTSL